MTDLKGILGGLSLGSESLERVRIEQAQQLTQKAQTLGGTVHRDIKQAEKAAKDFEALLMQQMMKSMWTSVPQGGMLSGTREEEYFRDMLNEAVSDSLAANQSMGIKEMVLKEFKSRKLKE